MASGAPCQLGSMCLFTVDLLGSKQVVACGWFIWLLLCHVALITADLLEGKQAVVCGYLTAELAWVGSS